MTHHTSTHIYKHNAQASNYLFESKLDSLLVIISCVKLPPKKLRPQLCFSLTSTVCVCAAYDNAQLHGLA